MALKHAFIAPTKYLHLIPEDSKFHLLLAHLLKDEEYCAFYRKRKANGDFIIIDNGSFEFKKPLEGTAYRDLVLQSGIVPDIVVAPDYPFQSWQKTVESTLAFNETVYNYFDYNTTRVMAVPQSEVGDYAGWIEGYKALTNFTATINSTNQITTTTIGMSILGIPNAFQSLTGTTDISYNRIFATTYLQRLGIISPRHWHHYLGLGNSVRELQIQKQLGVAKSNDSSSAFWRGIVGAAEQGQPRYDDSESGQAQGKIKLEVEFDIEYNSLNEADIQYNIEYVERLIK